MGKIKMNRWLVFALGTIVGQATMVGIFYLLIEFGTRN